LFLLLIVAMLVFAAALFEIVTSLPAKGYTQAELAMIDPIDMTGSRRSLDPDISGGGAESAD